jgi:hypothetical protein
MKPISLKMFFQRGAITLLAVSLLIALPALAQSGGPYVLDWSTIDGGGKGCVL